MARPEEEVDVQKDRLTHILTHSHTDWFILQWLMGVIQYNIDHRM